MLAMSVVVVPEAGMNATVRLELDFGGCWMLAGSQVVACIAWD